jgi:hypothetical protein
MLHHEMADSSRRTLYTIGGVAALIQLTTILAYMIVAFTLGVRPTTVEEIFILFQTDRLAGILRDDFFNLGVIAMYLGTFPALYAALRRENHAYAALAAILTFIGVTTCFATHSGFSMLHLSDQYAAAISEAQQVQILAAGEAVLASDMWHSSGGFMASILLQGSGVIISMVMIKSKNFSKITAYTGLLGNAIDLVQHLLHPFAPSAAEIILRIAGPFYLIWFPMLARDLLRLRWSDGVME